jgi:hypothetical protein
MIWYNPADPVGWRGNPVTRWILFLFFTKTMLFWFFLNRDWPKRPADLIKTRNPDLEPGRPLGRV